VKFQKRTVEVVYPQDLLDSPRESPWGDTHRDQKEGLELGKEEYDEIAAHCRDRDIDWFASAWDPESLEFVHGYGPPHHKIASAQITNQDLLEAVADLGVHTFISTALSGWDEVDNAVEVFRSRGCAFTLMHCIGTYPMDDEEANLSLLPQMRERYDCPVGYSSHEKGLICSTMAAALGATAIERHITLDRTMYGSDQAASLERRGLELLVRDVRALPEIWGDGEKRITDRERPVAEKLRNFVSS
jgi:N-acetylneuraminate synthase